MVDEFGRGTAPWTPEQIARIQEMARIMGDPNHTSGVFTPEEAAHIRKGNGFTLLGADGFTGHHANPVKLEPRYAGDPRNIVFLEQGSGNAHMVLGHFGGTQAPKAARVDLIDRPATLQRWRNEQAAVIMQHIIDTTIFI